MKQLCGLICGLLLAQPVFAQPATEKAEKRLAELLAPGSSVAPVTYATRPISWPGPKAFAEIVLPIRPYVGVPVFPSRAFRHTSIYIRIDRGIESPADLKGRRVGVPEYQVTANVWARAVLSSKAAGTPSPQPERRTTTACTRS